MKMNHSINGAVAIGHIRKKLSWIYNLHQVPNKIKWTKSRNLKTEDTEIIGENMGESIITLKRKRRNYCSKCRSHKKFMYSAT